MTDLDRWFPLARSEEVIPRRVVHTALLGHEIVLWRSDDGALNAWENRCPHRGVRLSIGFNTGSELRCQYHGWRFAGGSGQCTFIPAHPQQKPATTIRATTYRVAEQQGFVWASLGTPTRVPEPPLGTEHPTITLRSEFVAASAAAIAAALRNAWQATALDAFTFAIASASAADGNGNGNGNDSLTLMLQPMNGVQTIIHGVLHTEHKEHTAPAAAERLAVLRRQHTRLAVLRDALEERQRGATTA